MEKCARDAGRIFAGTLSKKESYRTEETILTEYLFKDAVWVRGGDGSDSASVIMQGGSHGGMVVHVEGTPDLEIGKRFVVFAQSPEQSDRTHHYLTIRPNCLCRVLGVEKLRDVETPAGWKGRRFRTENELLRALRSLVAPGD